MILLRVLIFPFIIASVIFFAIRRRRAGRRPGIALAISFATILFAALGVTTGSVDAGPAVSIALKLFLLLILGFGLYACIDVGLFFERDTIAYWVKGDSQGLINRLLIVSLSNILGILLYTGIVCRVFHLVVAPVDLTNFRAIAHFLASNVAFVVSEELSYRGCFQPLLAHFLKPMRYGTALALVCVSLVFAGQHVGSDELATMLMAFPVGIILGYLFYKYGLAIAICVHLTSNLLLGVFLPSIVAHL